jgi:coenzyme F420 biosynthesis associated uncharacterized protein
MAQFVDWDLAAATAAALGKAGPTASYEEAANAVADLRGLAEEASEHVTAFTGLRAQVVPPPVRVVDRRDWATANIDGLRKVINPLAERLSGGRTPGAVATAIGSRFTGVQAGTILAYLSGKVLGQYEVFSGDPGQLLLVAPNIVEAERKLSAAPRDFRLWVCLHEVTHRVQFTAVPWMRGHFLGEVGAFVDASQLDQDQMFDRLRRGVSALADAVRDPESRMSVLDLVQTPGQRAVLDRLTALMTVLEGHAEYVMDGVGPTVVPSVDEIRAKFNKRRETANPLDRVLRKLLGVEVKLRQYAEGRKFVHAVVERVGMEGFNKIWESPLTIPRLAELSDPDAWVNRVHGPGAGLHKVAAVAETVTVAAVVIEEPPVVEPVVAEEPAAVEEPVVAEEPAVEEPAAVVEPVVVDEPPAAVEEPVVAEEPAVEEPAAVVEPVVVDEPPAAVEEPVVAEESAVEELAAEEPVVVEDPEDRHDSGEGVASEGGADNASPEVVPSQPEAQDGGSDEPAKEGR